MIELALLLLAVFVVLLVVGSRSAAPPGRAERLYLYVTPAPLFLAFVFPVIFVMVGTGVSARPWLEFFAAAGVWLSIGLALVGIGLVARNRVRTQRLDWRLAGGTLLASIPALMLLLIDLLYWTAR